MHKNFASAFPYGVKVGDVTGNDDCKSGRVLSLSTAQAVTNFLPSGGTPRALDKSYSNPGGTYNNVFAGQVVALTISVGFDNKFPDFGASDVPLRNMIITSGVFKDKTVGFVLAEANKALAGCSCPYSISQLNDAVSKINESFPDGKPYGSYIQCPPKIPTVTLKPFASVCAGSPAFKLVGGYPAGGKYYVNNVLATTFNPTTAGTYSVRYVYTNSYGCSAQATGKIIVKPSITVYPGTYGPLCVGGPAIKLTGQPSGGTWTGTGVTYSNGYYWFNPSVAGSFALKYTVPSNDYKCGGYAVTTVLVRPRVTVYAGNYGPLCQGEAAIKLGGTPAGGTWSGPGVSMANGSYWFTPANAGSFTLTYKVPDTNYKCGGYAKTTILVKPRVTVNPGYYGPLCVGGQKIKLGGSPSGGVWTGTGVSMANGYYWFTPSAEGSFELTYKVPDNNYKCGGYAKTTIKVRPRVNVYAGTYGPLCVGEPAITLGGTPEGGIWSGTGVKYEGGVYKFYPSAAGTFELTYKIPDTDYKCGGYAKTSIKVRPRYEVKAGYYGPLCVGGPAIKLGGSPSGGTWTGDHVTYANGYYWFTPTEAGAFELTYKVPDSDYKCGGYDKTTIKVRPRHEVVAGNYGPLCVGGYAIKLDGGSPEGGTWSGQYVTMKDGHYYFTPTAAGEFVLTYKVPDSDYKCGGYAKTTIKVRPVAKVYPGSYGPFCQGEPAAKLGGYPAGGTWSGPGVTKEGDYYYFNPANHGTFILTYTVPDSYKECGNSAKTTVLVRPHYEVEAGYYGPLCEGGEPIKLDKATPAGGTWSGPYVTHSNGYYWFTPTKEGEYELTYKVEDTDYKCGGYDKTTIKVRPQAYVKAGYYGPLCEGDYAIKLDGGSPEGGTWQGEYVSMKDGYYYFTPTKAGEYELTYKVPDTDYKCGGYAKTTIKVRHRYEVKAGYYGPLCVGGDAIKLDKGTPEGGIWTGEHVTYANGYYWFTPTEVGAFELTYKVPDTDYKCGGYDKTTIKVRPRQEVVAGYYGPLCVGGYAIKLDGGSPEGGSWSGQHVSYENGYYWFTPSAAGEFVLTYKVEDTDYKCGGYATTTIKVRPIAKVYPGNYGPLCVGGPAIDLGGYPAGGTWSGENVTKVGDKYQFTPSEKGTFVLTYTVPDSYKECGRSATTTILVRPNADVVAGNYGPLCVGGDPIKLGGTPAGGVWTGDHVTYKDGYYWFTPSAHGEFELTYKVKENNYHCGGYDKTTIKVRPMAYVKAGYYGPVCVGSYPIKLDGGSPEGGTWSGDHVTMKDGYYYFNPTTVGEFVLTYKVEDNYHSCGGYATTTIKVRPGAVVTVDQYGPLCVGGYAIKLGDGSPAGGSWSGEYVTYKDGFYWFTPSAAGEYELTYKVEENNYHCGGYAKTTIKVNSYADVEAGSYGPVCVGSAPIKLNGGSPAGGTWSGEGVTESEGYYWFNPSKAGSFELTYTVAAGYGHCGGYDKTTIEVKPFVVPVPGTYGPLCVGGAAIQLNGEPDYGKWSGNGVSEVNGVFWFTPTQAGTFELTYTVPGGYGKCGGSAKTYIEVKKCMVDAGCSPGYWKNHTDKWGCYYTSTSLFFTLFADIEAGNRRGLAADLTLLAAISAEDNQTSNNGGYTGLARAAGTALLNACHYGNEYKYTKEEIISAVVNMFNTGTATIGGISCADVETLAKALDYANNFCHKDDPYVTTTVSSIADNGNRSGLAAIELGAYPNPFAQSAKVNFTLREGGAYSLILYDLNGKVVREISSGVAEAGKAYSFTIDGEMAAGVYIARLKANKQVKVLRIMHRKDF
ncbi:T9SS type A sorting domain-containing protein [Rufibacter latericius]|uniref:T9SS type A sorting domain-containing protein n=1 Tax=Rufibacter latericius TaxID=2487040 RepID=UPI001403DB8B|nr:T9SS type A sorting domain-containing protein [Rufibacter latericius]